MNHISTYPKSAFLYFIVVLISTLLARIAVNQKKRQLNTLALIILIFTFISGFRAEVVGTDTLNYVTHINYWQKLTSYSRYPTEPGLKIISLFSSYITNGYTLVLVVIALIINTLIIYRLWDYREQLAFEISIFIYALSYFFMTFSGIRQWLAISIIFWSSKYLIERKHLNYIFLVGLASLFHNTAIIAAFIPLIDILINKYTYERDKLLFMGILVPPVLISSIVLIEYKYRITSKYSRYLQNIQVRNTTGLTLWIRLAIVLLVYIFLKREYFKSQTDYLFYKRFFWIYFIGIIIMIPGYYIQDLNRIAFYYTVHDLIVFGVLGKHSEKTPVKLVLILILTFTLLMFYLELKNSGLGHMPYIPYWKSTMF